MGKKKKGRYFVPNVKLLKVHEVFDPKHGICIVFEAKAGEKQSRVTMDREELATLIKHCEAVRPVTKPRQRFVPPCVENHQRHIAELMDKAGGAATG